MSRFAACLPLLLLGTGCVVWPAGRGPEAPPVPYRDALVLVERGEAVFVDVRPREAYEEGHIPGALHVPAHEIEDHAAELRRLGRLPILYCG